MKTIYIIGDDKLGRCAMGALGEDAIVLRNRSVGVKRVIRLIRKGVIRLRDVIEMGIAELRRSSPAIPDFPTIETNRDLQQIIQENNPDRVVCFRAGLVLSNDVLGMGPEFLNIHCADLPGFAGLGAIRRALDQDALVQNACLHEMVGEIDAGKVLCKEPFELSHSLSYRENEERSYSAGLKILLSLVQGQSNSQFDAR